MLDNKSFCKIFLVILLTSSKQAVWCCQPEILKMVATPCGDVLGYSIGKAEWITSETERYFVKKDNCSVSSHSISLWKF